ncbi:MAG TPA: TetR family transcriptional regulator [Cyclobacteriaceae bacterium]|nr:TetR/AcrR family transcriptional regulator [Cyclobacteriaceae bacterium]HRK55031.1 TetR family transcriptional regulator [Cyclobacteriaceae bacterium]
MSKTDLRSSEELILNAAIKVFTRKGYAGARMEEIAKEAGINRALLHYYFRDKETMFNLIFETKFKEFFTGLFGAFQSDAPFFEKIKRIIDHEITVLSKHPDLARFVIMEIAQQPDRLIQFGQKLGLNPRMMLENFQKEIQQNVLEGKIRPIDGRQLLMNIISICIYPFVAKSIIKTMMQMDENTFLDLMGKRKKDAYEFIINAITP